MIIHENIYGLFDYFEYTFPSGDFSISIDNKKIDLISRSIVILDKDLFKLTNQLMVLYQAIINNDVYNINEFPLTKDDIAVEDTLFFGVLNSSDEETKKIVRKLIKYKYYVRIKIPHEIENVNPMDFIVKFRDESGLNNAKYLYFKIIRNFYNYILTIQSPYINTIDLNQIYSDGVYSYFEDDMGRQITKVLSYKYDCWMPKIDHLYDAIKSIIDDGEEIRIEDLFMARAKVYLRLENYSMAIIEAVISLEIIVPKIINSYLRINGVNKDAVEDFNNKFGLSVRVKAMLKLILPKDDHMLIDKVGMVIKLRNKIMHEGLTNTLLDRSIKIDELIDSCEKLKLKLTSLKIQ